jgi:hypothetical protein
MGKLLRVFSWLHGLWLTLYHSHNAASDLHQFETPNATKANPSMMQRHRARNRHSVKLEIMGELRFTI